MELKANFKASGGSMKADFGTVTDLSSNQREEYENRIEALEREHEKDIKILEEEHRKDIEVLEEKHEKDIKALEEEHEKDIEALEEEHEKSIEALEEEKDIAYENGLTAGKTLEHDTFWNNYQNEGKLRDYSYTFSGRGWNDETFKPKYNITALIASGMFALSQIGDLEALLKKYAIKLTTNNATKVEEMFYRSAITVVPEINVSSATNLSSMFSNASNLHTIRKLIISNNGNQIFTSDTFYQCNALKNLTINGVIGSDIDLRYSPLSYDSINEVIYNLSTDVEFGSKNAIFSKSAVDMAFESFEGANDGSESQSWSELCRFRPMWNIFCE